MSGIVVTRKPVTGAGELAELRELGISTLPVALGRVGLTRPVLRPILDGVTVAVHTLAPITLNVTLAMGFVLGTLQSGTAAGAGAFLAEPAGRG